MTTTTVGKNSGTARRKRHPLPWTVFALVLLLVASIVEWERLGEDRLKREVEELRRAGEPMLPEEFNRPAVADAANAAVDLRAAGARIDDNDPRVIALDDLEPLTPLTRRELAVIKAAVEANAAALADVDSATAKPGVDWQIRFKTPVADTLLPDINPQRGVVHVLAADLLYAHQQGDDARALRRAMQIRFVSRAVGRPPFIISQLVAIGFSGMASSRLIQIAPDLKVGGRGGASPREIKAAIDALLTRDAEDTGLLFALRSERMMCLDAIQAVMDGRIKVDHLLAITGNAGRSAYSFSVYSFKPLLAEDARFSVRHMTQIIDQFNHGVPADLPALRAKQLNRPGLDAWSTQHRLSAMLLPGTRRFFEEHYRGLTLNRLAATALAIRCYCVDHDGRFPSQLNDLVPRYLPAVPADPMASGRVLGYVRDRSASPPGATGAAAPIIYSLGANGTDEGGSEQPVKPANREAPPWDSLDVVVHLTPQPRKPGTDDDATGQLPATAPATRPSGK
jgi:hypothetical protein